MSWKLKIFFDDGSDLVADEDFATEQEALDDYNLWLESWSAGRNVLRAAGREYSDKNIEDYEIWEE